MKVGAQMATEFTLAFYTDDYSVDLGPIERQVVECPVCFALIRRIHLEDHFNSSSNCDPLS